MLAQRLAHRFDFLPFGFWIATLASIFYFFAIQVTFPITPLFIEQELGGTKTFIGTAVLVVAAVEILLRLPMGQWADRFGRRFLMLGGALLNVLFLALTALSSDTNLFIVARVVHGLSLAVYVTCAKIYISDIVPTDRAGEAQGINTSAFALALIAGPLTGEGLKNAFDFRTAFAVGAAIAALAWVTLWLLPREAPQTTVSPSLRQGLQAVFGLRGGWAALLTAMAGGMGFVIFFVYFPSYAEHLRLDEQVPNALAHFVLTLAFSLFAVVNLVALPIAGRYSDQHGRTAALIPGLIILLPALLLLAIARHYLVVYSAVLLIALGFSFFRAMMDAIMQDACPRPIRPAGMAILFSVWSASIGLNSQLIGWLIDRYGFESMFIYGIISTLVYGLLAIALSRTAEHDRATLYKGEFPPLPPS
jgi:MFS family permease